MLADLMRLSTCSALLSALLLTGCGAASKEAATERHHEKDGHDHSAGEHSHIGPHGGHLIELGSDEAYHAELLHDESKHRVTVYILDGQAKSNVAVSQPELVVNMISGAAPKQFKLVAVTQANELQGMSSCFQADNEELCEALDAKDAKGRVAVSINGKQFVGEIENHDHDDKDHDGKEHNDKDHDGKDH